MWLLKAADFHALRVGNNRFGKKYGNITDTFVK